MSRGQQRSQTKEKREDKKMKKIEIKSFFADWHEVDRETAKSYILHWLANMPAIRGKENKIKFLQDRYIRGISINELMVE